MATEIDATSKVLKRQNKHDELSRAFLNFFRRQVKQPDQIAASLKKLEGELLSIYKKLDWNQKYQYFNFLNWCRNKQARLD